MTTGTRIGIAVAGLLTFVIGAASLALGWLMWALALNGFMGHAWAVEVSMVVYIGLAFLSVILATTAAVFSVHFLSGKRSWHPAVSVTLATILFGIVTLALHFASIMISVVVADQLRTTRTP